jgi:sucrose phosphorylase
MSLSQEQQSHLTQRLHRIYDDPAVAEDTAGKLAALIEKYREPLAKKTRREERFDSRDVFLITYGDMVRDGTQAPLKVLHDFAREHLTESLNTIHILPCFPYSSDDGFSVIDYRQVDPNLGDWPDLEGMAQDFRLMYDYVCNHCSARSNWFKEFVEDREPGKNFFLAVDPETDLSAVIRPRPTPLLTEFQTATGPKHVWSTFSADQVDLNFRDPRCLLEMLDVMLMYLERGATVLRLDAIAFLWKEIGTSCLHLPQTHEVVKLMRDLVDILCEHCVLLTETNVPHRENVSYFGDGDEAHMVYQFSLPPLILHGLLTGSARFLTDWAANLEPAPENCTFLNFTASHDGVGVRPLEGLVSNEEVQKMCDAVRERGGQVSMRTQSDGSQSPYELNITYFEAVSNPDGDEDENIQRFLCSQAIALSLQGVPAVYFHSFTATPNFLEGVRHTGRARTINRRKWKRQELDDLLAQEDSVTSRVFDAYRALLQLRRQQSAFHPLADQDVLELDDRVFAVKRTASDASQEILCLFNLSNEVVTLHVPGPSGTGGWTENLVSNDMPDHQSGRLILQPHGFAWLSCIQEN